MFELDRESGVPLAAQIAAHFRGLIVEGVMRAYDRMPSSRILARNLGVSRGTTVAAYDQLVAEGYLVTKPKGATCRSQSDSLFRVGILYHQIISRCLSIHLAFARIFAG